MQVNEIPVQQAKVTRPLPSLAEWGVAHARLFLLLEIYVKWSLVSRPFLREPLTESDRRFGTERVWLAHLWLNIGIVRGEIITSYKCFNGYKGSILLYVILREWKLYHAEGDKP